MRSSSAHDADDFVQGKERGRDASPDSVLDDSLTTPDDDDILDEGEPEVRRSPLATPRLTVNHPASREREDRPKRDPKVVSAAVATVS